jgi:hypothetical protein
MTERKLAAIRRNQKLSHGPITAEDRERIRAALLRHGYDAQAEEAAMRALGEDPEQFQDLLEGLWQKYNPTDALQEGLVIRLARAMWLLNRADRMQEGYAVRQAQDMSNGRQDRLHGQMMRLKMTADSLRLLAQSVAREHYVTTPEDLEKIKNLHQEGVLRDLGEIALALFYQLQAPGAGEDGEDPEEKTRRVMNKIRGIFGLSPLKEDVALVPSPQQSSQQIGPQVQCESDPATVEIDGAENAEADGAPDSSGSQGNRGDALATDGEEDERYPRITAAEWEARERPRQLLENILMRQVESCEAQRKAILKESLKGSSPYERAAEIAPTHPHTPAMQKMEDYNLRQVERITNLLIKLKRQESRTEALLNKRKCRSLKRYTGK